MGPREEAEECSGRKQQSDHHAGAPSPGQRTAGNGIRIENPRMSTKTAIYSGMSAGKSPDSNRLNLPFISHNIPLRPRAVDEAPHLSRRVRS